MSKYDNRRRCSKCGVVKPTSSFYPTCNFSWCKECSQIACHDWYVKNRRNPNAQIKRVFGGEVRAVEEDGSILKRCPECGKFLPVIGGFYRCSSSVDGASSMCRPCTLKVNRRNYQKNKDSWTPTRKRWLDNHPGWRSLVQAERRVAAGAISKESKSVYTWCATDGLTTRCVYCGKKTIRSDERHVDHFIPIAKGGDNSFNNLVIACQKCNQTKSDKDPAVFAREVIGTCQSMISL